MRFGFTTDWHLKINGYSSRIDDYQLSILNKVRDCYQHASTINLDFMINGGDTFDAPPLNSFDVVEMIHHLVDIFREYGKPTYFIIGNHDIYGNNPDRYKKSALRYLERMSNGLFVLVNDELELPDCVIHACHTYHSPMRLIPSVPPSDKFQIVVDHHLLHDKEESFNVISTKDIGKTNANLVLSGDLHCGYPFHYSDGTAYYNPGSLSRSSTHHIDRIVKMGVFDYYKLDLGWMIDFSEYIPKQRPGREIFKENIIQKKTKKLEIDSSTFINNFAEIKKRSVDIFQLLEAVSIQDKKPKELMDFIKEFKEVVKV